MKILFIISSLFFFGCACRTSADKIESNSVRPTPTTVNANSINANSWQPTESEADKIDVKKQDKLGIQNENFKQSPAEFRGVDFRNFTYPTDAMKGVIKLQDGGFEYEDKKECDNHFGRLNNLFFVDLKGQKSKQAVIYLTDVACGCGFCDGGSAAFYIYEMQKNSLQLLWSYMTGSYAYGGGLKSFSVKDKQIVIEEFGRCSDEEAKTNWQCLEKFRARGIIRTSFSFNGKNFFQKSKEIVPTAETNVMNYRPEIDVNE